MSDLCLSVFIRGSYHSYISPSHNKLQHENLSMTTLKLTPVGDGYGVVLPEEVLNRLQATDGAELQLIDTPNGVTIQKADAETASQLEIAIDVMNRRHDALRRLAE